MANGEVKDKPIYAYPGDSAVALRDRDLLPYLLRLIDKSTRVVAATVFIVDPRPETDPGARVPLLLDALARARWRGVDARLLVGASRETPGIELANRVARAYAERIGVPCRQYVPGRGTKSLHAKYLVADDQVVVGSHNWSHQSLQLDSELSVAVRSPDLATALGERFLQDWNRSGGQNQVEAAASSCESGTAPSPLTTLTGGEVLECGPAANPDDVAAYRAWAAEQSLRYHPRDTGVDHVETGGPTRWVDGESLSFGSRDPGGPPVVRRSLEGREIPAAVTVNPPPVAGRPITMARAAALGRLFRRASDLEEEAIALGSPGPERSGWVALVSGPAYHDLARRLLRSVRRQVLLSLFFVSYLPGRVHLANDLVEALVAAHDRGCQVKVVLDLDRPDDPYGSRFINRAAYRYLREHGVEVTWDKPETVNHQKVLVVDGTWVLCGSHNWTAGSLRDYDDHSLLLESPELAAALSGRVGL